MEVDEILVSYHILAMMQFMWSGVNLRVSWSLLHLAIALSYIALSLNLIQFLRLIIYGVTWCKGKSLDVVTPEKVYPPLIKMDVVAILKEHLGVEGRRNTLWGEMGYRFIHPQWSIYPQWYIWTNQYQVICQWRYCV